MSKSKKNKKEKAWEFSEEDKPHIGEIWMIDNGYSRVKRSGDPERWHYLLVEECSDSDGFAFYSLSIEHGIYCDIYLNFQLDSWTRIT
jgi:hypothetical protein